MKSISALEQQWRVAVWKRADGVLMLHISVEAEHYSHERVKLLQGLRVFSRLIFQAFQTSFCDIA